MWSFQPAQNTQQSQGPSPGQQPRLNSSGNLSDGPSANRQQEQRQPQTNSGSPSAGGSTSSLPSISVPKGGGAIRGMGEKSSVDTSTGAVTASIPLHITKARGGFEPQLALQYNSGTGNGSFGFGWQLPVAQITRRTDRGLPLYRDEVDSDTFVLSGFDDLVPLLKPLGDKEWERASAEVQEDDGESFSVRQYLPRLGALTVRIEQWTNREFGDIHWRVISAENVTTVYGEDHISRIFDPEDPTPLHPKRTFSWLPSRSWDDRGNATQYMYKREDLQSVDLSKPNEASRIGKLLAYKYLKRIKYGNITPEHQDSRLRDTKWLFELVLDYGDHNPTSPNPEEPITWPCRRDPFSTFRPGFEVRQYRLCQRILMFHHFPDEPGIGVSCLVGSTDFTYRQGKTAIVDASESLIGEARGSFIEKATSVSYIRQPAGYDRAEFPPLEFSYADPLLGTDTLKLDQHNLRNLPQGLDGSAVEWVDLHGEGMPGILAKSEGSLIYKPNLGGGVFGEAQRVDPYPNLCHDFQLVDLTGDGCLDWVDFAPPIAGFFKGKLGESWEQFQEFRQTPNVDWKDRGLRFLDLTGDSLPDVVLGEGHTLTWYQSQGEGGFGEQNRQYMQQDELSAPRLMFADPVELIWFADMTGDGLMDVVRIDRGGIRYWPNLGYGRFGHEVIMSNAPILGQTEDCFHRNRIRLADLDGSGTTDLVYLGESGTHAYYNECGNAWQDGILLEAFPRTDNLAAVHVVDLLGSGTMCLVWSSSLPTDAGTQMRYIDLVGGQKPHLLTRMINNLGTETSYNYVASTKFYQSAKREGIPWITPLSFPIHVVENVEVFDRISRSYFRTRYEYHHGYFDGREREFCGFGRVDQYDTEDFDTSSVDAANHAQSSDVPPLLTRHWFHTGQSLVTDTYESKIRKEYYHEPGLTQIQHGMLFLAGSAMPEAITTVGGDLLPHELSFEELAQAIRALRGSVLREEVFALDAFTNSQALYDQSLHPYVVNEYRYNVNMLQPYGAETSSQGVFFSAPAEKVAMYYERRLYEVDGKFLADPRVEHELTLRVNAHGQPLEALTVSYSRRHVSLEDQRFSSSLSTQYKHSALATVKSYTNAVSSPTEFRIPLQAESKTYELYNTPVSKQDPLITNLLLLSDAVDFMSASSNESQDLPYDDFEGVLADDGAPRRRKTQHSRTYYRSNDLSTGLRLGEMQSRALSFQAFELVGTAEHYNKIYVSSNKASEAEFNTMVTQKCGLVHTESDQDWWAPSGKSFYSPTDMSAADELQFALDHFFTVRRYRDAFFKDSFKSEAVVEYDAYDLCVLQTRDALGSYTTVGERNRDNSRNTEVRGMDYRILMPREVMDANRNCTKVAYDTRGFPVRTATGGKPEEELGDVLDTTTITTLSELDISAFLENPDLIGRRVLGSASTRIIYDLFAYADSATSTTPQPAFTASIARTVHVSDPSHDDQADLVINFSFSDGFGRAIQSKIQAAPGPVPRRDEEGNIKIGQDGMPEMEEDPSAKRWIGSGWSVFDNKGNVVRHFEPFFTYRHNFEYNLRVGASTTTFYDPISRSVGTLSPDNSWSKVDFDPWRSVIWDTSDTVLIDNLEQDAELGYHFAKLEGAPIQTWYQKRISGDLGPEEKKAAEKSAAYAATPSTTNLNPSGQVIFSLQPIVSKYSNTTTSTAGPEEFQSMTAHLDIQDRQTSVEDGKGRTCAKTVYNVAGNAIYQSTMDGGERWTLYSLMGEPVYRWNSRGFRFTTKYDELRRTVAERLVDETLQESTILVREFGESRDNAERDNLRGKLVSVCDQAGKVITEKYDFKGQLLETTRVLAESYNTQLDWSVDVPLDGPDYSFSSISKQDALGRPTQLTQFNGSKAFLKYDSGGKLYKIDGTLENSTDIVTFVENIEYNAKGLKTRTTYGNGVVKEFRYDPLTQRLRDVTASRGSTKLQDLHYVYDAQGNIVHIRDAAQETVFFRNEVVSGDNEYTYDSVGRLIEATGREHLGQLGNDTTPSSAQRPYHDFQTRIDAGNDPSALGRYLERYTYDSVNNILSMQHDGTPDVSSMTRNYKYADIDHSNRLTSTVVGSQIEEYKYEGLAGLHGNITSMPHLSMLQWNFMDQIQSTAKTRVNNGGTPGTTWYQYEVAGQRVRKVTESQTVAGQLPRRHKERIYLGACEVYREYDNTGSNITLERCTLNVTDGSDQVARVDIRTKGTEQGVPASITRYQITNHLQSVSMELDETGKIASYEEYTPFGSTSYSAVENLLEVPEIRRWNNKERDDETGLYHCGARYYAPWLGRWTSADPSGLADGLNVFAYSSNNPIMIKDPSGRGGVDWGLGELGVYADQIANRLSVGHNVQKEHTLQKTALKLLVDNYKGKLYNWNHDLTIAVETGKGYWHTAKSTAERVIRLKVQGKIKGEEIKTLNEFVHQSVDVIKDVNQKMGWGNVLKEEQAAGILHQLGQVHNQMTLSEMGQFIKLMRKGDEAGMDKLVDSITARSDLEKEREMAELINKELAAKKEAETLKAAAQGVKEVGKSGAAANATKAAGKAGAGKLMMRGAGVALSLLQLSMAETTEEKIDATVGLVGNVMTEIPHPVVRAAGGGIVVGQLIETFFHVSDYAAEAGMKVNVGMRQMGFNETTSTVVGGIVTVASTPVAIPVAITNRYLDIAGSALRRLF